MGVRDGRLQGVGSLFSMIIVKGVCDYADSHKHKRWGVAFEMEGAGDWGHVPTIVVKAWPLLVLGRRRG
jgi:hypothetical protein